ncbi:MAG: hypothetical protein Q9215_004075 [Flavoplaca cf. flavocitrina]
MSVTLSNDILQFLVSILAAESAIKTCRDRKHHNQLLEQGQVENKAKSTLLALRRTCHFLALSITPYLFSHITIDKIDKQGWRHLRTIQKSASIPSAVKSYMLQPAIVHTAPVVKSSPNDYYGELFEAAYYVHEPRYSALVAEHEMRQRVKAHWDEQQHFMIPDYGSIAWLARSASNWFWRSTPLGSALKDSIFLNVIHDFTNLRELTVGFEDSRRYQVIGTVAEDLSVGLGSHLAGSGAAPLETVRLLKVWPKDLEVLVQTMEDVRSDQPSLPKEKEMTTNGPRGFAPGHDVSATDSSNAGISWRLKQLDIEFTDDRGIFVNQPINPHLTRLLAFTPSLTALDIRTARKHDSHSADPSLISLHAPPLSRLEELSLNGLRVDKEAVLSLLKSNESLRKIFLGELTLVDEVEWTEVAREAELDEGAVGVVMRGLGYGRDGDGWKVMKWEDKRAWEGKGMF